MRYNTAIVLAVAAANSAPSFAAPIKFPERASGGRAGRIIGSIADAISTATVINWINEHVHAHDVPMLAGDDGSLYYVQSAEDSQKRELVDHEERALRAIARKMFGGIASSVASGWINRHLHLRDVPIFVGDDGSLYLAQPAEDTQKRELADHEKRRGGAALGRLFGKGAAAIAGALGSSVALDWIHRNIARDVPTFVGDDGSVYLVQMAEDSQKSELEQQEPAPNIPSARDVLDTKMSARDVDSLQ